jgi:hypothetical protein
MACRPEQVPLPWPGSLTLSLRLVEGQQTQPSDPNWELQGWALIWEGPWGVCKQGCRVCRRHHLQGFVQVPAGLLEGLLGRMHGVPHSSQRVDALQTAALLLFLLSPYLGQFL